LAHFQALVDGFENAFGKHPGQRRDGAKGICAEGHFTGTAEGRALSTATAFGGERVPVLARFSVTGCNPQGSDKAKNTRGLALQTRCRRGGGWRGSERGLSLFSIVTLLANTLVRNGGRPVRQAEVGL
jgi:catalase